MYTGATQNFASDQQDNNEPIKANVLIIMLMVVMGVGLLILIGLFSRWETSQQLDKLCGENHDQCIQVDDDFCYQSGEQRFCRLDKIKFPEDRQPIPLTE